MESELFRTASGIAGTIAVASITPGPNNFLVMRAATRAGMIGALPAIIGIVVGSLALLMVIVTGVLPMFGSQPWLRSLVALGGCAYLFFLGARLLASNPVRSTAAESSMDDIDGTAVWRLAGFQFLNPKSWALVLAATATASVDASSLQVFVEVGTMLVMIPTACALLWSSVGASMTRHLAEVRNRRRFDRAMGLLLIGSALLMLRQA